MRGRGSRMVAAAALALVAAPPVAAQYTSDSLNFLKAVQERDGSKAQELLDKSPTATIAGSRDEAGQTALHIVTKRRDLTWLSFMIGRQVPINARDRDGQTALADAAQIGWTEGAALLLRYGAKADIANDRGETPLILATQARSAPMVKLLLDNGADPRATDSVAGLSAIDYATRDGRSEPVLRLLKDAKPAVRKEVAGPTLGN